MVNPSPNNGLGLFPLIKTDFSLDLLCPLRFELHVSVLQHIMASTAGESPPEFLSFG